MNIMNRKWFLASTIAIIASLIGVGSIGMSSHQNANAVESAGSSTSLILLNSGTDLINSTATSQAPQYIGLGHATAKYADNRVIVPVSGTLGNLYVQIIRQSTTQTSGAAWTFTVDTTNSITPTTLTCSTPLTGPPGHGGPNDVLVACHDTTHTVAVNAGDLIVVSAVANGESDHYTRVAASMTVTTP